MIVWLTAEQKELVKEYWITYALNENKKMYIVNDEKYKAYIKIKSEEKEKKALLDKRQECKEYILSKYTETDQRNCLMWGTAAEKKAMSDNIKAVVVEFREKGVEADFEQFIEEEE